jgi:hypothetical protein
MKLLTGYITGRARQHVILCPYFCLIIRCGRDRKIFGFTTAYIYAIIAFQLYHGSQFYWWRKPEYLEKTTDLLQVTDKLYHIINKIKINNIWLDAMNRQYTNDLAKYMLLTNLIFQTTSHVLIYRP